MNLRRTYRPTQHWASESNANDGAESTCVARFSSLARCCSSSAFSASSASRRKKAGCATCWTHLETVCQATDGREGCGGHVRVTKIKVVALCSRCLKSSALRHITWWSERGVFKHNSWFQNTLEATLRKSLVGLVCYSMSGLGNTHSFWSQDKPLRRLSGPVAVTMSPHPRMIRLSEESPVA